MRLQLVVPAVVLFLLAALVVSQLPGGESPALAASKTVTDAVTVIESDVGWSLRLRAFEVLRKEGTADAIAEVVCLTEHKSLRDSTMAYTKFFRMKRDAAKVSLMTTIEGTSEKAALSESQPRQGAENRGGLTRRSGFAGVGSANSGDGTSGGMDPTRRIASWA